MLSGLLPMLATPGEIPADDAGWAYEMKWDGVRALVAVDGDRIEIVSRLGNDITRRYSELAGIAADLAPTSAVLDGEIVAFDDHGRPSFERLQSRMHSDGGPTPVAFLCFDLLRLDEESLLDLPYEQRRTTLDRLGLAGSNWQTPPVAAGGGQQAYETARELGLEGVVAKRRDSPYRPGRRSTEWRKVKINREQEFVVGGWLPGDGRLVGHLGSLLVGYFDDGRFVYGGRVGSGLNETTRSILEAQLAPRADCPFDPRPTDRGLARAVWVEPRLVVEVKYREWTNAGRLRQPSFTGIRDDKLPEDVVRED